MNDISRTATVRPGREGFALVTTVLVVLVLSVLAVGVAWIATSEKKTSFAEGVHVRSLFSADAGGEAGINLVRTSDAPLLITSWADSTVHVQPQTVLDGSQNYAFHAFSEGASVKAGWDPTAYLDFDYRIGADGRAAQDGQARVEVVVSRLFKLGY